MRQETIEAFVARTLQLLELERDAEIEEARALRESRGMDELQARGVALSRLRVADEETGLGGRTILHLEPSRGGPLPAHRFRAGDVVALTATRRKGEETSGVASRIRADRISVTLDHEPEEALEDLLDLGRVASDVTWRRMKAALEELERFRRGPAARVIDVCFGRREPSEVVPEPLEALDRGLDASQQAAVAFALASPDICLLHGPPGTGKTTALVELVRQEVARGHRVLACAPSNVAVDNLVERLSASGIRVLRLGHPARLLPQVLRHSLDALVRDADESGIADQVRRDLDGVHRKLHRTRDRAERDALRAETRILRKEVREIEKRTIQHVLAGAEVILTTNTGAADGLLADREFDLVVIDEAAQAVEASCWIPMLKARRTVLAGDHHQLPPTIRSQAAEHGGLATTLFDRLARSHDEKLARRLDVQYRMHTAIMGFSAAEFYDGRLVAHASVEAHRLTDLDAVTETEDTSQPFVLIDTAGCDFDEAVGDDGDSKNNEGEAGIVVTHLQNLVDAGVEPAQIAIITPYNAQVRLLRERLQDRFPELEIDSVDGFQGREKEAVLISLVRSNPEGTIGFLADDRRLNVAITRARRHATVIGDSATVARHAFIGRLLEYIEQHGEYRSAWQYL